MTYFIETYGCQMNLAESAALETELAGRGWEKAGPGGTADLVLINSCAVRETAETRVRGRIAHYAALKKKRPFALMLAGCMAGASPDDFPGVDYLMGTQERSLFPAILDALEHGGAAELSPEREAAFSFAPLYLESGAFRAFVPVMHGCNNFCSYCIVPYVRGREISRDPASIAAELETLAAHGVREITLLGQNVNSYRFGELDFPGLLGRIADRTSGTSIEWVRFLSANPGDFSPKTIEVMARYRCFCRSLHLPVQHGSDRILQAMNRRCSRAEYLALAAALRAAMPGISLSTDIMVGFPGETEEDMAALLSLMEEAEFSRAYMYHYNVREGTAAARLPGRISYALKIERLSRVIALQKKLTLRALRSRLGSRERALVEGISRKNADEYSTRTEKDDTAVLTGAAVKPGTFVELTHQSLRGTTFRSVMEEPCPGV